MEKIREALAKARMDKSFREQHPVVGEGRDGAPDYEFGAGVQGQDSAKFEQPATNDKTDELPTDMPNHADGWKSAPGAHEADANETSDQEPDIDPPDPGVTAVTDNAPTVSYTTGSYLSPTPQPGAGEQSDLSVSVERVMPVEQNEDRNAASALPQKAPAVVQGRLWTGRNVRRAAAAALIAALVVGLVVHNFFYPLNAFFDAFNAKVDWLGAVFSESIGPHLNQLLEWLSRVWMNVLDRIRELVG